MPRLLDSHLATIASRLASPQLLKLQKQRGAGVIALYHRVSPERDDTYAPLSPAAFEQHCEWLRKSYEVVPLATLLSRLVRSESLAGLCAITFDDGYRDFLDHAYPVLKRLGLPATHFLVADCVEHGQPTWNYRIRRLARAGRVSDLEGARDELSALPAARRYEWLETRERDLDASGSPPLPRMLSKEDLARIDPGLVEWGSHTSSHAFLDRVDAHELTSELAQSRKRLEQLTGRAVRYLAYPNGRHSRAAQEKAAECGFTAALIVGQREVRGTSAQHAVPRFDVGMRSPAALALELTGVVGAARALFGRG